MTITIGKCSRTQPQCSKEGVARCGTCKTWYCSVQCQTDHWPRHWRECLPLPDLEWLVQDEKTQKQVFVKKNPSKTPTMELPDPVVYVGSASLQKTSTSEPVSSVAIETKTVDVGSTDSSLQGEASSTPVKTAPETEDSSSKAPAVSATAPLENKGSPPATSKTIPDKEVAPVAVKSNPSNTEESGSRPSPISKSVSQNSGPSMYTEAQISSSLPVQTLTKKVCEIVSPLDVIVSPSDFIVRLADAVSLRPKYTEDIVISITYL